jgi:hypothetical protein
LHIAARTLTVSAQYGQWRVIVRLQVGHTFAVRPTFVLQNGQANIISCVSSKDYDAAAPRA